MVLADAQSVVEAVGPDARLLDFTNQPALVYSLLGLDSPTRYFHVSMAIRAPNQADLIDELEAESAREEPERLVVVVDDEGDLLDVHRSGPLH